MLDGRVQPAALKLINQVAGAITDDMSLDANNLVYDVLWATMLANNDIMFQNIA